MREYLVTVESEETDPERAESVTCLAFEPTIPSKVKLEKYVFEKKFIFTKIDLRFLYNLMFSTHVCH